MLKEKMESTNDPEDMEFYKSILKVKKAASEEVEKLL